MEIAKPPVLENPSSLQRRAKRAKEYSGPVGILAACALGLTLLCSVSAMAMGDLNRYVPLTIVPLNIFDIAVSNLETAAALTEQVVTVFVPTGTPTAVPTETPSLTPLPSATDTARRFVTITPLIPRRTRIAPTLVIVASRTPTRVITRTPSRTPTRRPTVTPSRTPTQVPPTFTDTPLPPPTFTDTPLPPPTTAVPPTTQAPPPTTESPTETNEPPITDVPIDPSVGLSSTPEP